MTFLIITAMEAKVVKIHKTIDKICEDIVHDNQKEQVIPEAHVSGSGGRKSCSGSITNPAKGSLDIPITTNSIKAVIWDMFSGATDASAKIIEWASYGRG